MPSSPPPQEAPQPHVAAAPPAVEEAKQAPAAAPTGFVAGNVEGNKAWALARIEELTQEHGDLDDSTPAGENLKYAMAELDGIVHVSEDKTAENQRTGYEGYIEYLDLFTEEIQKLKAPAEPKPAAEAAEEEAKQPPAPVPAAAAPREEPKPRVGERWMRDDGSLWRIAESGSVDDADGNPVWHVRAREVKDQGNLGRIKNIDTTGWEQYGPDVEQAQIV
jgi:hypothetical protein